MGSYARDFYAPKATQQPTIGDTKFSVVRQDHMGWMNCDGRLLSTDEYPLLFRVIQYSFGGAGDQFALPDMRSRVPGAIYQGTGLTNRPLGTPFGTETHTLTIAQMPAHKHGSVDVTGNNNGDGNTTTTSLDLAQSSVVTSVSANIGNNGISVAGSANVVTGLNVTNTDPNILPNPHSHSMGSTGGDQAHNIMQPTLFIGNMFMYSGKIHSASSKWRYEIDTNIL